jgi:Uma2 family endonuclease
MTTHRFSVLEYYRLGELGLLSERTELIDGIIIDMEPIGPWHADIVDSLTQAFIEQAHGRFRVRVQQPIDLGSESQPQPDLALCRLGRYRDRHPGSADIYLIVEVADTTLDFDLADKRALYAHAGVAEYWVIGVQAKKLTRFVRNGVEEPVSGTKISPVEFPDVSIDLAELFG